MSTRLPDPLFAALEARLHLAPLGTLKAGYQALSRDYRSRTVSEEQRDDLQGDAAPLGGRLPGGYTRAQARALGYLAARFPATYAAMAAALRQVPDAALAGCESVLDVGAGPGTATWALRERLPTLKTARLLESNGEMLGHAQALAEVYPGLKVTFHSGDLAEQLKLAAPADILVMAYVLSELDEAAQTDLLKAAWDKARKGIFLLEPGTPETSRRVLAARAQWVRMGGNLIAPCPQSGSCPMDPARPPKEARKGGPRGGGEAPKDLPWCHFAVRLERRGLHKSVKGGDLGYEDEKFSWVYVSKDPGLPPAAPFRLHSDPRRVNRNINLDVCDREGERRNLFYRRREASFSLRHAVRQLKWGDGWDPEGPHPQMDGGEEGPQD
ncbi:MAG TPA: small ribosomal subunit Rsm22 family protein [bacterium]|jgi:ribosomal protein RSM22 (predicted rRNA methylase)|nr:small ribosomal subunit Rsm22 family protein [bacterium]